MTISCVDLFCGAGGLTHGFVKEGLPIVARIDLDAACRYPYEKNNNSVFLERDVSELEPEEIEALLGEAEIRVLAGCAPCQPFSTYSQRYELDRNERWGLLYEFARLAEGTLPEVITMENVPSVQKHEVFHDFVSGLKKLDYHVWYSVVDSTHYECPSDSKKVGLACFAVRPYQDDRKDA